MKYAVSTELVAAFALNLSHAVDITRIWPPIVTSDPDDDLFVLCAIACGADYTVTADHHLLSLFSYQGIRIVQVDKFLHQLEVHRDAGEQ